MTICLLFAHCIYGQINSYKNKGTTVNDKNVIMFDNLVGPNNHTIIRTHPPTSWKHYNNGSNSRLAVFLTDTLSSWLGVVHACKSFGIPFKITDNIYEAINHDVMLVYPSITDRNINYQEFIELTNYPKLGGTLIACNVLSAALSKTFGFKEIDESYTRFKINFNTGSSPLLANFTHPHDRTLVFAGDYNLLINPDLQNFGTFAYMSPEYQPLATFEDGQPAIIRKIYPNGVTYAIGFDFGFFNIKSHQNFDLEAQRSYVNGYEPSADLIPRLIKQIYLKHSTSPVTKGMVPESKQASIMISHDIDYFESLPNALVYAFKEKNLGIKTTYFMQTKYIHDGADSAFFTNDGLRYLVALKNMGMEIGSHTVSHTMKLDSIKLGTGREKYPSYRPYIFSSNSTANESLLGELRVSKFLLDHFISNQTTISYRSGYLHYPQKLPESLSEIGYSFNSSHTANDVLTHVPYRAMENRSFDTESEIFDFCVTIDDEYGLPTIDNLGRIIGDGTPMIDRLQEAINITDEIGKYGGIVVILIHPNNTGSKLDFIEEYVTHFKEACWFGSVGDFGRWWSARDKISIDCEIDENLIVVNLYSPEKIKGFNLDIPQGYKYIGGRSNFSDIISTSGNVLFNEIQGEVKIVLSR